MRRDHLYDSSSSSSDAGSASHVDDAKEDAEVRAKLNERLASLLGLDLSGAPPAAEQTESGRAHEGEGEDRVDNKPEEEEFEFRLFSTSSKTAAPAKVVLAASDDEDAPRGDGGFTVPVRPTSYYVAARPTPEQLEKYRWAAVSGQDVVLGARKRAWGLERPWRVTRLRVPPKSITLLPAQGLVSLPTASAVPPRDHDTSGDDEEEQQQQQHQQTAAKKNRKRPGKKRRVASRTKARAEAEKREAEAQNKMTKEEHLKEKKKRLNREKKLKRRAKEKEKKLATRAEGGGASASDDDDSAA